MGPKSPLCSKVGSRMNCSQGQASQSRVHILALEDQEDLPPLMEGQMKMTGQIMSAPLGPVFRRSSCLAGVYGGCLETLPQPYILRCGSRGLVKTTEMNLKPQRGRHLQDQGQTSRPLVSCPPAPCHTPALGSDLLPAGSLTTYGLPRGVPLYLTPTL